MESELITRAEGAEIPRRHFLRDVAAAATAAAVSSYATLNGRAALGCAASTPGYADAMDQALEMMAGLAPLTNHGPMAAEALVALGRADSVVAFVEAYKKRFTSNYPASRQPVTRENWRAALGDGARVADWTSFFNRELQEAAWPHVLGRWAAELAPGLSAAAAHGLIRTGHAVRSLSVKETDLRRRELAEGLSYWAAYFQRLPEAPNAGAVKIERFKPAQAFQRIPTLPMDKRPPTGSIMIGLRNLNGFPPFAGAADLVETGGQAAQFLSEVTETFATAYVKNVNQRNFVTLIHAVTSTTCLRSLLPYLSPGATQSILRYGWQMAAALYAISASNSPNSLPAGAEIKRDDLIGRAVATQEEHAIKFTEACLREYAINPKQVYLWAARDAVERLG